MKCAVPGWASRAGNFARAFTLLEVMIALMIFFMAIFAILGTVTRSLGAARSLQQKFPDIDALGAEVIMTLKTNKLEKNKKNYETPLKPTQPLKFPSRHQVNHNSQITHSLFVAFVSLVNLSGTRVFVRVRLQSVGSSSTSLISFTQFSVRSGVLASNGNSK